MIASIPVAAVTDTGIVFVNSGSAMTLSATILLSIMTYLQTFTVSVNATTFVISLDVPAVVGIAINGNTGFLTIFIPPY